MSVQTAILIILCYYYNSNVSGTVIFSVAYPVFVYVLTCGVISIDIHAKMQVAIMPIISFSKVSITARDNVLHEGVFILYKTSVNCVTTILDSTSTSNEEVKEQKRNTCNREYAYKLYYSSLQSALVKPFQF